MLRVHVEHGRGFARIRLEGRLVGAWVEEVQRCWQCVRKRCAASAVTVELDEVTFVDSDGQLLLEAMFEAGAELRARGALSRFLVERIQSGNSVTRQPCQAELSQGRGT